MINISPYIMNNAFLAVA